MRTHFPSDGTHPKPLVIGQPAFFNLMYSYDGNYSANGGVDQMCFIPRASGFDVLSAEECNARWVVPEELLRR